MAVSHTFWDRIANRYARAPVRDAASYQEKLAVTREYLRPDMEVLEFGCGTGSTAIAHAPYVKHIRATDVSPKMLAIARRKAEETNITNVTFERHSIEELPLPAQGYDAVLGLNILHLLEDLDGALGKVNRMLVPDGVFVTSTPVFERPRRLLQGVLAFGRLVRLLPLVRMFSEDALHHSLASAGFAVDYRWQPAAGKPVFIVAKKSGGPGAAA